VLRGSAEVLRVNSLQVSPLPRAPPWICYKVSSRRWVLLRAEEAVAASGGRPCYEEWPELLQGAGGGSVAASGGRPCYKALPELLQGGRPELLLGAGGGRELPAADGLATKGCRTCCKGWPELLQGGWRQTWLLPAADSLATKGWQTCCQRRCSPRERRRLLPWHIRDATEVHRGCCERHRTMVWRAMAKGAVSDGGTIDRSERHAEVLLALVGGATSGGRGSFQPVADEAASW
jgi:hypothetical protein